MEQYYTCILYSKSSDKYYVGYTHNILTRLDKHNAGATKSTKPGRPWELVYYETFNDKTIAIKRENQIKRMKSRAYIESLINKLQNKTVFINIFGALKI